MHGEPAKLADLPEAAIVPRVPRLWRLAGWTVFLVGVCFVLVALGTLADLWLTRAMARAFVYPLLPVSFLLAALNTYLAANAFGRRRDALSRWNNEWKVLLIGHAGAKTDTSAEIGKLGLKVSAQIDPRDPWFILAHGCYMPMPYCAPDPRLSIILPATRYLELIAQETHAARAECAKMAGALGGLFVTALQVFGKLL